MEILLTLALAVPASFGVGYVARKVQSQKQIQSAEGKAKKLVAEAQDKAREMLIEAKDQVLKEKESFRKEEKETKKQLTEMEVKVAQRQDVIEKKIEELDKRHVDYKKKEEDLIKTRNELNDIKKKQEEKLEKIAKLNKEEAKDLLLEITEKEYSGDILRKIKIIENDFKEEADKKAREIITLAVERTAVDHATEIITSTVSLPSDEMKGRIIGREGRNIRSLEEATGCDIIVDDTPETIVISGFDPVRRQICKIVLERMMGDGRINPTRIEEQVEKAKHDIGLKMKELGEQAVFDVGVAGLPPEVIKILGRLYFRTSYGQNVLKHSMEVAHLAGMLAVELGANVDIAKKAGLLHDLGKAVDHEVPGTHAAISRDILKKYGVSQEIIHAVEAHHEEVEAKTVEAIIVKIADAISGARPGARRESMENYIKRLTDLENIANSFKGVEKTYAIQAGREVRIIVKPEELDDLAAEKLSHKIAKKIEEDLNYPGQIKVNVIREQRFADYAK